jgi:hypothetical protein
MAWRNPRFSYLDALGDAYALAAGNITTANAVHADHPITRLFDGRRGPTFKFNASASDHTIVVDRGAGSLTAIDRVFVPWQAWGGATFKLEHDDNSGFTSATQAFSVSTTDGEIVDEEFTSTSERYLRFTWPSGNDVWEMTELLTTAVVTTTRGPEPLWIDQQASNAERLDKASGASAVIGTGASTRTFALRYRMTTEADTTALDALIQAVGVTTPFLFDPPFDDEDGLLVRFIEDPIPEFDHPIPSGGEKRRRYTFELAEVIE